MKKYEVLLFSDLHCSNRQLANLHDFVVENKNIKALIFAGDVVNMGEPVWFMEKFVKIIDELKLPFLWVPGNNDFGRAYYKINAKYKSLEGRVVELNIGGIPDQVRDDESSIRRFTGVGGSPASWSGQYAGEDMIDKKKIGGSIFISHFPPPGILTLQQKDLPTPLLNCHSEPPACHSERSEESIEQSEGAASPRSFVNTQDDNEKLKNDLIIENCELKNENSPKRRFGDAPLLHVCGHLHYRWGTAYLGQTKVIQLASLETGHYAIMDLVTLAVEFGRF
jgi:hypothetical protein